MSLRAATKFEIRISKYETNSNDQKPNAPNFRCCFIGILYFGICLVFRASCLVFFIHNHGIVIMENSQKQPNKSSPVKKQLIIIFFLTTALFAGIAIKAGRDYHWWLPETEIVSVLTPEDLKTKIDVNESPWYELLLLPKVGEAKAKAIVAYREKYGRFESLDELSRIDGIGKKIIALLKDCAIAGTGSAHVSDNHE